MNYSFKHPKTGEWVDPIWRKATDKYVIEYDLYLEGNRLASIVKGHRGRGPGWLVLPNVHNHIDFAHITEQQFDHLNNWVGPFVDRHAAMEYALWQLGYLKSMGM